jgi:hypothetical protein
VVMNAGASLTSSAGADEAIELIYERVDLVGVCDECRSSPQLGMSQGSIQGRWFNIVA